MKILKTYVLAFDTTLSLIVALLFLYLSPENISGNLSKDLLGIGIGTLSIIFSIFFAALAFIISASDDEFVAFLEEEGLFTELINLFKWTVGSLFVALLYSLFLYGFVAFGLDSNKDFSINSYYLAGFCLLFFYSLIATMLSTNDAIKYSKARIKYIRGKRKNQNQREY